MTAQSVLRALRDGQAIALGPLAQGDEADVLRAASRELVERWARGAYRRTDGLVALWDELQLVRRWSAATGEATSVLGVGGEPRERGSEASAGEAIAARGDGAERLGDAAQARLAEGGEAPAARGDGAERLGDAAQARLAEGGADPAARGDGMEGLGEAARAWLAEGGADPSDVEVFRALRASDFAPGPPIEDPLLALPPVLLREALGAQPGEAVEQLLRALEMTPDPGGVLAPALAAVAAAARDRAPGGASGPAAELAALIADAGATDAAWLRAGGRMVAGWGRLRRRYPALLALVEPATAPEAARTTTSGASLATSALVEPTTAPKAAHTAIDGAALAVSALVEPTTAPEAAHAAIDGAALAVSALVEPTTAPEATQAAIDGAALALSALVEPTTAPEATQATDRVDELSSHPEPPAAPRLPSDADHARAALAVEVAFAATARGDETEAIEAIATVEAALPSAWFEGLLLRADLFEASGDIDRARALLREAAALAPDRPDPAIIMSDLEVFEGDDAAALAALGRARRVNAARGRRARAHYRLGQLTQAAGLGFAPERRPAEVPAPAAPVTGAALTLLDPASDPHARAAALDALGHDEEHAALLADLFATGQATEAEVARLADRALAATGASAAEGASLAGPPATATAARSHMADTATRAGQPPTATGAPSLEANTATLPGPPAMGAPSLAVDRAALAEQLLAASGAALPGASGVAAAESAAQAASLLRQAGALARASEVTQTRRDVLDRTLEAGEAGPAVTAALLDMAADLVDAGRLSAWEGRSSWILRSIREAAARDSGVLSRAARLVRSLAPARPDDSARVADAALALLPDDEAGIDALPADAATAAFELLTLRRGPEEAHADPRFAHAAPRRVATARDLLGRGRVAEAATVATAVLRKPLAARDRSDMLAALGAALERPEAAEEARAALLREVAALGEAARTDPAAAQTTLQALAALWDPATLAQARTRVLAAWRTRALPPAVAAAGADLVGHSWAAWILTPGEGPPPEDPEVLLDVPGGPYFAARALLRGRADRGATPPARRVSARSPLPLPLVDAVKSGAPLLELAALLARANYDPKDMLALLVQ